MSRRTYTWDRANRMLEGPNGLDYRYDGLGNRIVLDNGTNITNYLLDMQPGLTQVLGAITGANTERYIHSLRGIHTMENNLGTWSYAVQDGLGSVRSEIDAALNLVASGSYQPYGRPIHTPSAFGLPYQFTGEMRDFNGLQYHRARYYSPDLGVFLSLDPFEGMMDRPMSLNGYSWVEGNVSNLTDPCGQSVALAATLNSGICSRADKDCSCFTDGWLIALCRSGAISCPPRPTPTPPRNYRIGQGLPTPIISDPAMYGGCLSRAGVHRPGCAVQAYLAAATQVGQGGSLTWEQFIGLTITGEASAIYIRPGEPPLDLQCVYNGRPDPGCGNLRILFERTVMRQLTEACGGWSCTEDDFVKFMAGPPFGQFGVQAWYQAGQPGGTADISVLLLSNGSMYQDFEDNAVRLLSDASINGCGGLACSWGNPSTQPPPPDYYVSHKVTGSETYGVFNGRVYFVVGR